MDIGLEIGTRGYPVSWCYNHLDRSNIRNKQRVGWWWVAPLGIEECAMEWGVIRVMDQAMRN